MTRRDFSALCLDLPTDEAAWEVFHENSKLGRFYRDLSPGQAAAWTAQVAPALGYDHCPLVSLPEALKPMPVHLSDALAGRTTPLKLRPRRLDLRELATLLYCAYGVNREADENPFRRPLRTVPSAGALYPLEIYLHSRSVTDLPAGLYHYHPVRHELRQLRSGDLTSKVASALVSGQKHLALTSSLQIFIGAVLERTLIKYGERGYRFVLLEAGHVGQNLSLAALGLGLGCVNIGGYHDRMVDALLGFDGLRQSALYLAAVGGVESEPAGSEPGGPDEPGEWEETSDK
jgi:SagB-type dehydrogenase family enzyme